MTNIVEVCKNTVSSVISMKSDFISKQLGVDRTAVWDLNKVKFTRKGLTEVDQTTVEIIKELREVLNCKCNISVLSSVKAEKKSGIFLISCVQGRLFCLVLFIHSFKSGR